MKILITGGTGFIGRFLCQRLDSHELTVLSRNPARAQTLLPHSVEVINSLNAISPDKEYNAIINLAGEGIADKRWTDARKKILESSRIDLTHELVALIQKLRTKPDVFISGSAIGFYGDCADDPVTEFTTPTDEYAHRLCASWEMQALRAKAYDVRVCIVRTGLVIGRNGGFLKKMLPAFRLGLGGKMGNGEQWMSWIHIDDMLGIIEMLLNNHELSGIFNATSTGAVRNAEFTSTLAASLHRPALLNLPASVLQLIFGEMSHLLLTGQRVIPKRVLDAGYDFKYPVLKDALSDVLTS